MIKFFKENIKDSIAIGLAQLCVAISSIVMVRLYTNILSPEEYGRLSLALVLTLLSSQILYGPIGGAITRLRCVAEEDDERVEFRNAVIILRKELVFIGLAIMTIFILFGLFYGMAFEIIALFALGILFSIINGLFTNENSVLLGEAKQKELSKYKVIESISRVFIGYLFLSIFNIAEAALVGFIVATSVVVFFQNPGVNTTNSQGDWHRKILIYAKPFLIWGVITAIYLSSDRILLNYFENEETVGFYAPLYQIGYVPLTMIIGVVGQIITPKLYMISGSGRDPKRLEHSTQLVLKATGLSIVFTIIIVIFVGTYSLEIYSLFVPLSYLEFHKYLPLFVLAGGVIASGQICALAIQARHGAGSLMPVKLTTAIAGVIFNVYAISSYGLVGLIISMCTFSVVYFTWVLLLVLSKRGKI